MAASSFSFNGGSSLLLDWLLFGAVVAVVGGGIMVLFLVVMITSKTGEIFVVNDPFDKRLKMGLF